MAANELNPADLNVTTDQRPDDRFIPRLAADLAAHLAADTAQFGAEAALLGDVHTALADVIAQEAESCRRHVLQLYTPVNPDRDTQPGATSPAPATPAATAAAIETLEHATSYLLDKANFTRLNDVELDEVVSQTNSLGLRVRLNPERLERLSVWVRGPTTIEQRFRTWRHPRRGVLRPVPIYRRLAVVAKLRSESSVRLKLFKDIPAANVEALLPHAEVSMSLLDRLKLTFGSVGALGSAATKAFQAIWGGAAALSGLLWAVIAGMGMLAFRAFTGYRRSRQRRDAERTRHLYFQNLANNAAVIHSLLAMIGEEEVKEALLAYAFCWHESATCVDVAALDRRIETYLAAQLGCRVDFDARDALETLTRLELRPEGSSLAVLLPAAASIHLQQHWRERRSWEYHATQMARSKAAARELAV